MIHSAPCAILPTLRHFPPPYTGKSVSMTPPAKLSTVACAAAFALRLMWIGADEAAHFTAEQWSNLPMGG